MPSLSTQLTQIVGDGDDGWGILYQSQARSAAGEDIIMLAMGDHDFATASPIQDGCIAALHAGKTGYGSIQGNESLRARIAARASRVHGTPIAPSEIVLSAGGQAAFFAACKAALDPGDEAIVLEPHYATYAQTVRGAGAKPIIVGTNPAEGFQPNVERIKSALTDRTRALLINTPNNPTGVVYSREALHACAQLCEEHDLWLLSDEVYHSQIYAGTHLSPASIQGMRARSFIIDSMSKSHAMTGWRAGWLICPDATTAERVVDLFLTCTYGLPPFVQAAMEAGLSDANAGEEKIARLYAHRRAIALKALSQSQRLSIRAPDAAMYMFIDIRACCPEGRVFAQTLLDTKNVAALPGESFGASGAGHIRISLTAEENKLKEACERIASLADAWSETV